MSNGLIQNQGMQQSDEIDLSQFLYKLIDHYKLIIAATLIFFFGSSFYAWMATPIYKADALIQIESKGTGMSMLGEMDYGSSTSSGKEIEIISSRMVLGQTVERLNMDVIASPKASFWSRVWGKLTNYHPSITVEKLSVPSSYEGEALSLRLVKPESSGYQVFNKSGEKLLSGEANKLGNSHGISLLVKSISGKEGQVFTIVKKPKAQAVSSLRSKLVISEKGRQSGILEFSMTGPNRQELVRVLNDVSENYFLQNLDRNSAEAEKSLKFLDEQLPKLKQHLEKAEDEYNHYRKNNDLINLSMEGQSALSTIVKIETQLNELKFKESELSKRFTKEHPTYVSLLDNRAFLEKEKEDLNGQVQQFPFKEQELIRLKRDMEVTQQIYVGLLNKMQELKIAKAGTVGNVRIIDKAQAGLSPIEPKKKLIITLGTLLGAISGVLIVFARVLLFSGIEKAEELEKIGLPVYATVPLSDKQESLLENGENGGQLLSLTNPEDLSIEALRSLRTSLQFSMMQDANNLITITGPSPGVGKSFISANLAAILCADGQKKVLVVDTDMRKGTLAKYFTDRHREGLSEYLSGNKSKEDVIKVSAVKGLDFISRGKVPPNPSELLMQPSFKELLDWAKDNYDWVILDSPPVIAVTDAAVVARLAGITLMIGRFEKTRLKEVEVSMKRLHQAGAKVSGFVLNGIVKKASSYYYGGDYYYHYKYSSDKN